MFLACLQQKELKFHQKEKPEQHMQVLDKNYLLCIKIPYLDTHCKCLFYVFYWTALTIFQSVIWYIAPLNRNSIYVALAQMLLDVRDGWYSHLLEIKIVAGRYDGAMASFFTCWRLWCRTCTRLHCFITIHPGQKNCRTPFFPPLDSIVNESHKNYFVGSLSSIFLQIWY